MTEIRIPQVGMEMAAGAISVWLADDGASVVAGQPIYVLETDKVEMDIESPAAGILRHVGTVGEEYPVGELIARIE